VTIMGSAWFPITDAGAQLPPEMLVEVPSVLLKSTMVHEATKWMGSLDSNLNKCDKSNSWLEPQNKGDNKQDKQ